MWRRVYCIHCEEVRNSTRGKRLRSVFGSYALGVIVPVGTCGGEKRSACDGVMHEGRMYPYVHVFRLESRLWNLSFGINLLVHRRRLVLY